MRLANRIALFERCNKTFCCRCGLASGRCTKVCAIVTVAEDTKCQCQCPKSDCDASLHFHNDHTCQCQCKQVQIFVISNQISVTIHTRKKNTYCAESRKDSGTTKLVNVCVLLIVSDLAPLVCRKIIIFSSI